MLFFYPVWEELCLLSVYLSALETIRAALQSCYICPAVQRHLIQTFIVFGGWEVEVSLRAAVICSSPAGESSRTLIWKKLIGQI